MQQLTKDHNICVRVPRSSRKLDRFVSALGRKPTYLYSFWFDGNFVYVDAAEFKRVRPYVTKARIQLDRLLECWS